MAKYRVVLRYKHILVVPRYLIPYRYLTIVFRVEFNCVYSSLFFVFRCVSVTLVMVKRCA